MTAARSRKGRLEPLDLRIFDPIARVVRIALPLQDQDPGRVGPFSKCSHKVRPPSSRNLLHRIVMKNQFLPRRRGKPDIQPAILVCSTTRNRDSILQGGENKLQIDAPSPSSGSMGTNSG